MKRPFLRFLLPVLIFTSPAGSVPPVSSPVKTDESVILFTGGAWPSAAPPGAWEADIHGVIFEEEDRPQVSEAMRKALGIDPDKLTPPEREILKERLSLFMVDNERGKAVPVQAAGEVHTLPASAPNGHFRQTLTLSGEAVAAGAKEGLLPLRVTLPPLDSRAFAGSVCVIPDDTRPLVISDIDDTIKISHVRDRRELLVHTFARPFEPVPGMAERYTKWAADSGARFYYVSSSPWQLYRPLEAFRSRHGFPAGPWHLKHLRLMDPETIVALFSEQTSYKVNAIKPLFERWKNRSVVLIGDSGEQDPEIFGEVARLYPQRVVRIFIRNVTGEAQDAARYRTAFKEIDASKWQVFSGAGELPETLP